MRRSPLSRNIPVLLGCVLLLWAPPLCAQGLDLRMQKVLAKFVETTGFPMMGVGSWVGKGFNQASSDFDMRMVWPGGGSPAQQLAGWQKARTQMATLIKQEFGAEAGNILGRTNLYAPNQLMQGVENAGDAVGRFQQLKTVPNLGYSGPVNASTPVKYTEGLYGSGSQTYVQGYERAAGRLFYSNNGKCVTGLSELAHMGEGMPIYTAAGTANTAGQWAEHCLEELKAGRGDKVAKFLDRLERDLVKSRSLSGLPIDEAYRDQLKTMREMLKASPGKLANVADDVAMLVARGRAEAAILGGFENAGPMRRAYLRVMLDGVALKNQVGQTLNKIMQKVPNWVDAQNTMNFIVFCIGTSAASESLGRDDDVFETLSNVSGAMNPFKMIGPTLLAEVMAEIITQARLGGYDMAAGFQGAWDLMQGIYSAWGRADVDPDPRRKLTLADLVANFQYEHKLEAIVMAQAIRASTRGLGTANEQADQGVAQAIFAKCWPVIREAWRWERDGLTSEYLKLGSEVVHTPLIIYYKPTEPKTGEQIICEAVSADQKLGNRLERMKQIIRILYGPGSGIAVNYYWEPAGASAGERDWQRAFTFSEPGKYPVKVRLEVAPFTAHTETEPRVMLRREVPALVEVEVGGEKKPPSGPGLNVTAEAKEPVKLFANFTVAGVAWTDTLKSFEITLTKRSAVVLQSPGLKANEFYMNGRSPAWYGWYEVSKGAPCHLELNYTVGVAPQQVTVPLGNNADSCAVSIAQPRVVLVVSHAEKGVTTSEKELPGPTYKLDYTPKPGEYYTITAYALIDYTKNFSGPRSLAKTVKQQERVNIATMILECPQ